MGCDDAFPHDLLCHLLHLVCCYETPLHQTIELSDLRFVAEALTALNKVDVSHSPIAI